MTLARDVPIGVYKGAFGNSPYYPGNTSMGAPAAYEHYEAFIGRKLTYVLEYLHDTPATWAEFDTAVLARSGSEVSAYTVAAWTPILDGRRMVLGVPGLAGQTTGAAAGTTWADEANGKNDQHWTALGNSVLYGGLTDCLWRIGREFNGANFYPWQVLDADINSYITAYRRIVDILRGICPSWRFQWNAWRGGTANANVFGCYPGDAWVDELGVDCYDNYASYSAVPTTAEYQTAWQQYVTQPGGIGAWQVFAGQHGKSLVYPEWGQKPAGGDNVYYEDQMAAVIASPGVGWHAPWGHPADFGTGALPNAEAALLRNFAGAGSAPPIVVAAPPPIPVLPLRSPTEFVGLIGRSPHTPTRAATVVDLTGSRLADLQAVAGSVNVDATASTRRTAHLGVAAGTAAATLQTLALLDPETANNEVVLSRGVATPGGPLDAPLGVFAVMKLTVKDAVDALTIDVELADRSFWIASNTYTEPYVISNGDSLAHAVQAGIADRLPGALFAIADDMRSMFVTASVLGVDPSTDPWQEWTDLVTPFGAELFFDRNGVCVLRSIPDLTGAAPVVTYREGPGCTVHDAERSIDGAGSYNGVQIITEGAQVLVPQRATVWAGDGSVPKRPRPYTLTSPQNLTQAEAVAAAKRLLPRVRASEAITVTGVVNPAHDVSDVIGIVRARSGLSGSYAVQQVTMPLDIGEPMVLASQAGISNADQLARLISRAGPVGRQIAAVAASHYGTITGPASSSSAQVRLDGAVSSITVPAVTGVGLTTGARVLVHVTRRDPLIIGAL